MVPSKKKPAQTTRNEQHRWWRFVLPCDIVTALKNSPEVLIPRNRNQLLKLSLGEIYNAQVFDVAYDIPGRGRIIEAIVTKCSNGVAVNYMEPYMRRRDPNCLVVADESPSEKPRFSERFGCSFAPLRAEILGWLSKQRLIALPFVSGTSQFGSDSLLIAPLNAAFFAAALADLQGMVSSVDTPEAFTPRALIILAPPFRHTFCEGKQIVVHNRLDDRHEIFSLNLYPGPSAKKGVYGVLLNIGEAEGWITAHGSTVEVVTPYDNNLTILHEGASGGGKSEMLEHVHRQHDGRMLLGKNTVTGESRFLSMGQTCALRPVTDDMALCHPDLRGGGKRLAVLDAEEAWFLRVDHIKHYGTDSSYERLTIHPPEPLLFMNIKAIPGATCLLWEHIEDEEGVPCPNPRVIIPRHLVDGIVNTTAFIDVRSFGIRTPPCVAKSPSYGIAGLLHILPPALGWIWRLVAPRGYSNPSVTSDSALASEGVGSYWPFATGRQVVHANLLLRQIRNTPETLFTLCPNQHVGSWAVGFMPQWIAREYLARRNGAQFRREQLKPSRCSLFGYTLRSMEIEGTLIPQELLHVELQPEVGNECYDAGSSELRAFFAATLTPYLKDPEIEYRGRKIIETVLDGCDLAQLEAMPV